MTIRITRLTAAGAALTLGLCLTACDDQGGAAASSSTQQPAPRTTVTEVVTATGSPAVPTAAGSQTPAPTSGVGGSTGGDVATTAPTTTAPASTAPTASESSPTGKQVTRLDYATVMSLPAGADCTVTPRIEGTPGGEQVVTADGRVALPPRTNVHRVSRHPRGTVVLGGRGGVWFVPAGSTTPRLVHAESWGDAPQRADTSADGTQVAYMDGTSIVVADAETGQERSRTSVGVSGQAVAWVESGFAFVKAGQLHIQKAGATEVKRVKVDMDSVPEALPGDHIAMVADSGIRSVIDAAKGTVIAPDGFDGWHIEWSASGRHLLLGDTLVDPVTARPLRETAVVESELMSDRVVLTDEDIWIDFALSGLDRPGAQGTRVWVRCALDAPFTCSKGAVRGK